MEPAEFPYDVLDLRVEDLITDKELIPYQRDLDVRRVAKMARDWDPKLVDPLLVSVREDGREYLVRGQHRRAAAICRFGPDVRLTCRAFYELTLEEEARIYHQEDRVRKTLSSVDTWEAGIISRDSRTMSIIAICERYGVRVIPTGNSSLHNAITCISALERAYDLREGVFEDMIWLFKTAGWFDLGAPRAEIVRGVSSFLSTYRKHLPPREQLIDLFNRIGYWSLLNRARLRAQQDRISVSDAVRITLLREYDSRKRGANRLENVYQHRTRSGLESAA